MEFFERNYFAKNSKCQIEDINLKNITYKTFNCKSDFDYLSLPKLGIVINNYIYYFSPDLIFDKTQDKISSRLLFGDEVKFSSIYLRKEYIFQYEILIDFENKNLLIYGGDRTSVYEDNVSTDGLAGGIIALITIASTAAFAGIVFAGFKFYSIWKAKQLSSALDGTFTRI